MMGIVLVLKDIDWHKVGENSKAWAIEKCRVFLCIIFEAFGLISCCFLVLRNEKERKRDELKERYSRWFYK